jgi:hypothetical protein
MLKKVAAEKFDYKKMIADYMENGLLDNIVDMFKHDTNLYAFIGDLLTDERMRVRIGATALIETLKQEAPDNVDKSLPYIIQVLDNHNPLYRGDAAYLLGILANPDALQPLEKILDDENENVRIIAKEAIEDIESQTSSQ